MILSMLAEAWSAMGANRLRTFLTMLGMVIGVAAVVAMLAVGQGAQKLVNQTIASMGSNLFIVLSGGSASGGLRMGSGSTPTLTLLDADAVAELPGVGAVAPVQPGNSEVIYGASTWTTQVYGTSPNYLQVREWPLAAGEAFTDYDMRSANRVALLGGTVADYLFGEEDPVGKTIRIRNSPYLVVGALARKGQSLDGRDQDDTILVPVTTAQRKLFGSQFVGSVRFMMVQARSGDVMDQVERDITELLRARHRLNVDAENDFTVRNLTAVANAAASTTKVMSLMLGAIASVSLLVGGIGIMNIMLVSVTERTKEIGVRKAVGATRLNILSQFLIEAVVLTAIGGLAGLAVGELLAFIINRYSPLPAYVPIWAIAVGVGISAGVGIVFGLWPAWKAARLDPIEALRWE